jgi:hypothetical protein
MSNVIQSAFTNGELTPALHARIDLDQYKRGLKTLRNCFTHPHGGVSNRPGTTFVVEVKDSTKVTRLIPFQFNTTDTYCLEFGDLYIRVIRNGGQVLSGGSPVEIVTPYTEAQLFDLKFTQSADIITIVHPSHAPRELSRTSHTAWALNTITFAPSIGTVTGLSSSAVGATYLYAVTAVHSETFEEGLPGYVTSLTRTSTLSWTAVTGAGRYNVYLATNGVYYLIGEAGTNSFLDATYTQDKTETPPTARNPFSGANNYPATVGYFNQRLCFGRTNNYPQTIWMSKVGSFKNFTVSSPYQDDDAITVTIDSNEVNEIRHLMALTDLSVLTSGAEAVITSNDNAFVFANLRRKIQSYYGVSEVTPVIVGKSALFTQDKGNVVREITYDDLGNYTGNDRSIFSTHLFKDRTIVDWAYAKAPESIIWAVRNDGILLGLTHLSEQGVFAWHWHDTDGQFESVISISEGNESAVYVLVKRKINGSWKRYIERLHTRTTDDIRDCFFVDCGLSLDLPVTITGITQANPVVVTATAHGFSNGDDIDLSDIAGMTELNDRRFTIANVAANTFELTDIDTGANIDGTAYTAYESGGEARKAVTAISGLTHLNGKSVAILADGIVQPKQTVVAGAITLANAASRIHIGLSYDSDIETLKPPTKTIAGKKVSAAKVICQVDKTSGMFVGSDEDHLREVKQSPALYDTAAGLVTDDIEIVIDTSWKNGGSVFIRQSDPLPMTILSIIPDIYVGG